MEKMKKLPDAEFDIMKVVWANEPPMTTTIIMEQLGKEKSLMLRLVERGFLRSENNDANYSGWQRNTCYRPG